MAFWFKKKRPTAQAVSDAEARLAEAKRLFGQGCSCSQALLAAYSDRYGLTPELAQAVGAGFGGGMGALGETCGAVTGAFMVVGLHCGGSASGKKKAGKMVRELAALFKARNHGTMICRELLGCDPADKGAECKLAKKHCPIYVQDAAEILNQVLGD